MKTDEQILAELERAAAGLFYLSESEYPFETINLGAGERVGPEQLREMTGRGADARIRETDLEEFFRDSLAVELPRGGGPPRPASFRNLVHALRENLTDVRVYQAGEINVSVFVLGRSASGRWLGISTRLVQT